MKTRRLDGLHRGNWIVWQCKWIRVSKIIRHDDPHLIQLRLGDDKYPETVFETAPISAGTRVKFRRKAPHKDQLHRTQLCA